MSTDLIEKVDSILTKIEIPDRHSYFQIEKFIIGKEPTVQSQLWAIIREINARRENIDQIHKDLADAEDNLELMDVQIERMDRRIKESAKLESCDDLNIKELEITIRKAQRERESLIKSARKVNKRLKNMMEELNFLVCGYEQITEKYGNIKPFDDPESQREMWNEKLLEEFNLRMIFRRNLDTEFVKTVMCLHDEATVKKHVISLIQQAQTPKIEAKK